MRQQTTRLIILDYIAIHQQASSSDIARELGISKSGARYQLAQLLDEGALEILTENQDSSDRRGRPHKIYRLPIAQQPNNLVGLSSALLDMAEPEDGYAQAAFYRQLTETFAPEAHKFSKNGALQVNRLVEFLNQYQYFARWEARKQGPQIIFHNCPYASVWQSHPALCLFDQSLISHLTGKHVAQLANYHENTDKKSCIFQINTRD